MSTRLTIEADESLLSALRSRAEAQGKSVSTLAKEILEAEVEVRPLGARIGHLKGRLKFKVGSEADPWREAIRERNWRS